MKQSQSRKPDAVTAILPDLPRQAFSPQQQLEALRKVQTQAEQRVKLGMQLFKAAESRLSTQSDVLKQVRKQHDALREQVQEDVAKSLQSYDQWIGKIDENFTKAMRNVEQKVDAMAADWQKMRQELGDMMQRTEAMMDQSRYMQAQSGPTPTTSKQATASTTSSSTQAAAKKQPTAQKKVTGKANAQANAQKNAQGNVQVKAKAGNKKKQVAQPNAKKPSPIDVEALDTIKQPPHQQIPPPLAQTSEADATALQLPAEDPATTVDNDEHIYSQILEKLRREDKDK